LDEGLGNPLAILTGLALVGFQRPAGGFIKKRMEAMTTR
jgi:hypothetical protein